MNQFKALFVLFLGCSAWAAEPAAKLKFDFGVGKPARGCTKVLTNTLYTDELGYGFEPGADVIAIDRGGDPLHGDFITSNGGSPFYFSVKLPEEGNYKVTVVLGDKKEASITTVKAELRRLMLSRIHTEAGEFKSETFVVNVRTPKITGAAEVKLKPREKGSEARAWDDKLTLEFTDSRPAVGGVEIERVDHIPTIYIAGDSTSTDQPQEPFNSWGQMLTSFLKPTVALANHGESGESLRGFISEKRLDKIMNVIRKGDYLLIQMGHNDQKERGEGVGAFTTYKASLKRFIADAREHGATPILVTPMNRLTFNAEGVITNSLGDFPEAVRQTAQEENAGLIDLNAMSKLLYEALGPESAHVAFAGRDTTHHSDYGSYELARCIVQQIKDANLPITKYLKETMAFNPSKPDSPALFDIPAEPKVAVERPYEAQALPSLFVAGDSTANNTAKRGWGDPLADYFDPAKVRVLNRARAGRSSRTFFSEGLWAQLRDELKPGDFVLIQFGHNDGGAPDQGRGRASLPGTGEETKDFTLANGATETVHTFGWYLRTFVTEAKAKGATPVLLSPTVRNIWTNNKVERGLGSFSQWSAEVAKEQSVPFIDVTNSIADEYEKLGEEKVKTFFPEDHTHTSVEGADLNASLVVAGLKGRDILTALLSLKGQAIKALTPALTSERRRFPLPEPADPKLPTLFLIGDSTVRNGHGDGSNGQWGWGEPIVEYFDPAKINVVNRAVGGLSSRTYLTMGHWDRVMAMLKPGDFVMMQFGHNDSGALDDPARARGTLKGDGEESKEIDNPITHQHEVVHTYGWYLRKFIADAKAKGATPIVCSLIPRKTWEDGKIVRSQDYAKWAGHVAAAENVGFVDLNEIIARRYDTMGVDKVEPMFGDPHTHTSRAGAELNAECVIAGIKALAKNPLSGYFSDKASEVAPATFVTAP